MRQMTIEDAVRAGEEAMHAAARHAERESPGWCDIAYAFCVKWCIAQSFEEVFTAEAISDAYRADERLVQPPDERSFGHVIKRALRNRVIEFVDSRGRRRKGHGSRCDRYRSLISGKRWTDVMGGL